jgi:hypothetical protein
MKSSVNVSRTVGLIGHILASWKTVMTINLNTVDIGGGGGGQLASYPILILFPTVLLIGFPAASYVLSFVVVGICIQWHSPFGTLPAIKRIFCPFLIDRSHLVLVFVPLLHWQLDFVDQVRP